MPLHNVQKVLRKVLPEKAFDALYKVACNGFEVCTHIYDYIWYRYPRNYIDPEEKRTIEILKTVAPYTMTSREGLLWTRDVVCGVMEDSVMGAFVECGVARGGCSALMALAATMEGADRKTWLFDSFEGLPKQSDKDGIQKPVRHKGREANDLAEGYCLGTWDEVSDLLYNKLELDRGNVFMIEGWFQKTLPLFKKYTGGIAVLRLDGDWYESTKCCLENLYDNVVKGGWVIIDDYQLAGCKLAVDEFLASRGLLVNMTYDANGRAYWQK